MAKKVKEVETPVEGAPSERKQALEVALSTIEKQFGRGAIMTMGGTEPRKIASIPTGSLALDIALGIGGLPRE